mmetsp:Transcript_16004/g.28459  ORF Transcript_16004/g.28459 Transcript_16004/m.28459 type:complete len:393 (+) Transcript_16004:59-1237(+)
MAMALVTGSCSHVGSHVVNDLLQLEDLYVRAAIRPGSPQGTREALVQSLEPWEGDESRLEFCELEFGGPDEHEQLSAALKGVEFIIVTHVTDSYELGPGKHRKPLDQIKASMMHLAEMRRLLAMCESRQVSRMILVSSTATMDHARPWSQQVEEPLTEKDWNSDLKAGDRARLAKELYMPAYSAARMAAEQAALEFGKSHSTNLEVATIVPGVVVGPIRYPRLPTAHSMLAKMLQGHSIWAFNVAYPIADVRDVSHCILLAMFSPHAQSERFLLVGRRAVPMKEHFKVAAETLAPLVRDPKLAARLGSSVTPKTMPKLAMLVMGMVNPIYGLAYDHHEKHPTFAAYNFDQSKAARVLGLDLTTEAETLRDTALSVADFIEIEVNPALAGVQL